MGDFYCHGFVIKKEVFCPVCDVRHKTNADKLAEADTRL